MISRPPGGVRIDAGKPQLAEVQRLHEGLDHADRVILANEVFQTFREQGALGAVDTLNETLHHSLTTVAQVPGYSSRAFSHSLGR